MTAATSPSRKQKRLSLDKTFSDIAKNPEQFIRSRKLEYRLLAALILEAKLTLGKLQDYAVAGASWRGAGIGGRKFYAAHKNELWKYLRETLHMKRHASVLLLITDNEQTENVDFADEFDALVVRTVVQQLAKRFTV